MLPLLRKGNAPTILNLSSIDALKGSVGHSAYAATKGAIASMTRALALELAEEGITVNALCPGTVDTPMMHSLIGNPLNAGVDKVAQHPLGRVSSVDDQAAAAAFLCSADASYITGVTLSVDGGRAIR
jgi:NAD(P)-dependent dehydrogenase (short-subunit alcohol dehydrogenase family)